jgi:short-subunit dehydrogenase
VKSPFSAANVSSRRRVFITGASSGIGAALARHYAACGAVLGLAARRQSMLDELAASLPGAASTYAIDVRDVEAMRAAAEGFTGRHGCPDIVIATAGVSRGTLTEHPEDLATLREIIDTNVVGLANTLQPFLEPMRQRASGVLVGVASVAGYRGLPGAGAYSGSKAAVIAYMESLRVELRGTGVRSVTIAPGYIDTPMTAGNPYSMPFIISASEFARRFDRAIDGGKDYAVIPWQMAIVARLLRVMPNAVYDALFARAPRKPR